jgi:ribonuclease PH
MINSHRALWRAHFLCRPRAAAAMPVVDPAHVYKRTVPGPGVKPAFGEQFSSCNFRRCPAAVASLPSSAIMAQLDSAPVTSAPRDDGRLAAQLRPVRFQNHIAPYATGSTLIEWGNTRVICGVTVEDTVPRWMKEQGVTGGWITAEYSMLPYSTLQRKPRDITKGKIDGRSQEIQRLIGRAMRTALDLEKLGSRTIWVDCDVLQADGGTRTAAITGGYVALALAIRKLMAEGKLPQDPLRRAVAAVSVGIVEKQALLDLCYTEDAAAEVDLNLVLDSAGEFIELQGTGEEATFSQAQLAEMLELGKFGVQELLAAQKTALGQ